MWSYLLVSTGSLLSFFTCVVYLLLSQELQRQKAEYENKKKIAEQLRIQQEEEEEKEQRRRATQRLQDKQKEQVGDLTR